MSLETSTYIDGLVATNPTGTDDLSKGDDHIRLLKSTIKASFPDVDEAVVTIHNGTSAPASKQTGTVWRDTTNSLWKFWNGSAWITLAIAFNTDNSVDVNAGTIDGVTIGGSSAPTVTDLGSVATCDINGGTIDGVTIGGAVAPTVTNIDINGGTVDGVTIGTNSACTELQVDNINVNGNAITSTDTNGDVTITPNGTGDVVLDGIKYPQSDGSANQFVVTNGSAQLSFTGDIVEKDTSPTLGGDLDVGTSSIVSASNRDIAITPNGTGDLVLDGLKWPQSDGSANTILKTDGSAQLSWTVDSAEDWATKTDGAVASSEYSAKAYAIGGTGVTDTAGKGSAKEWATSAEDDTVDGSEYSAKHYSAKASASATSASASASSALASANAGLYKTVLDKTSDYTVTSDDQGALVQVDTSGGAVAITLPNSTGITGDFRIAVAKMTSDANAVTVSRGGSNTINGGTSQSITQQYAVYNFILDQSAGEWLATDASITSFDAFKTVSVSGQSDIVADSTTDTLTFAGSNITITTDASTDTVTFTGPTPGASTGLAIAMAVAL